MPNRDRTGRLGRGKNCNATARADRMGGRGRRPRRRPGRGLANRRGRRGR